MTAEGKPEGWAGRDRNFWANSLLEAIDYNTGNVTLEARDRRGRRQRRHADHRRQPSLHGDNEDNFIALDPATGNALWHVNLGARMETAPAPMRWMAISIC